MKKIKQTDENKIRSTKKGLMFVVNFVSLMDEDVSIGKSPTDEQVKHIDERILNGAKCPAMVISDLIDEDSGSRDVVFFTRGRTGEMSGAITIKNFMYWRYMPRESTPEEGDVPKWFIEAVSTWFDDQDEDDLTVKYKICKEDIHYATYEDGVQYHVYPFADEGSDFIFI